MAASLALAGTIGALMLVPCCLRRSALPAAATALRARMMALGGPPPLPPGRAGAYVDSINVAATALKAGRLVAFPTETVYGLGAHAFDESAVASIFTVKGRPRSDPLIVHVPSAEAAEALVCLDVDGLALMRKLMAAFWPGPLTLVAPAVPELPPAVTAGTGFVGVRIPAHGRAMELLLAAAVPVAAPSANRFGHVSPTRPEHVMDDLGDHDILVLLPSRDEAAGAATCCDVGIESTVLKVDASARELLLLRRGGVPEAELARWLDRQQSGYGFRVQPPKHAAPLPLAPPTATAAADNTAAEEPGMLAPGMTLTHYAPDLPSFLLAPEEGSTRLPSAGATESSTSAPLAFNLGSAVILDYGARLVHLRARAVAYRDLSPSADATEAAATVFDALRWAEGFATNGARCVLLPAVDAPTAGARSAAASSEAAAEHTPALADRLFRAASGRCARLAHGDRVEIVADDESA